jgi:hypothetical protein
LRFWPRVRCGIGWIHFLSLPTTRIPWFKVYVPVEFAPETEINNTLVPQNGEITQQMIGLAVSVESKNPHRGKAMTPGDGDPWSFQVTLESLSS